MSLAIAVGQPKGSKAGTVDAITGRLSTERRYASQIGAISTTCIQLQSVLELEEDGASRRLCLYHLERADREYLYLLVSPQISHSFNKKLLGPSGLAHKRGKLPEAKTGEM